MTVIAFSFELASSSHAYFSQFATLLFRARRRAVLSTDNTAVKASTESEIRADQLRSEIAQLEARYDGLFPPGVYSVLESLRQELIALQRA